MAGLTLHRLFLRKIQNCSFHLWNIHIHHNHPTYNDTCLPRDLFDLVQHLIPFLSRVHSMMPPSSESPNMNQTLEISQTLTTSDPHGLPTLKPLTLSIPMSSNTCGIDLSTVTFNLNLARR